MCVPHTNINEWKITTFNALNIIVLKYFNILYKPFQDSVCKISFLSSVCVTLMNEKRKSKTTTFYFKNIAFPGGTLPGHCQNFADRAVVTVNTIVIKGRFIFNINGLSERSINVFPCCACVGTTKSCPKLSVKISII